MMGDKWYSWYVGKIVMGTSRVGVVEKFAIQVGCRGFDQIDLILGSLVCFSKIMKGWKQGTPLY
jgi:hypothetical protein